MNPPKFLTPWISTVKRALDKFTDDMHRSVGQADFSGDGLVAYGKTMGFTGGGFQELVNKHAENHEDQKRIWRLHTLCWAAKHALTLDGDFVECGVYRGMFSNVVCDFVEFEKADRKFWLYDTFEGFSPKYTKPEDFARGQLFIDVAQQDYAKDDVFSHVTERFSKYKNVEIVKGVLPDALATHCPEKISYLHIDLNSPTAETLTLEKLFPLLVPGGMLIFDDYGWKNFKKQQVSAQEFLQRTGEMILELPTGQGLVIKKG